MNAQRNNANSHDGRSPVMSRRLVLFIAAAATVSSLTVTTIGAVYRGGSTSEKLAWVLVNLVVLLGAHLVPAISRDSALPVRMLSGLFWLLSMAAAIYGQASFFLLAQTHAGDQRASRIQPERAVALPPVELRAPAAIAADKATVQRDISWIGLQHCQERCDRLKYRLSVARARLDALDVEFAQAERRQMQEDAVARQAATLSAARLAAAADPVTMRIAHLTGFDMQTANLAVSLSLGLLLEGLGSLSWLIALAPRSEAGATNGISIPPDPVTPPQLVTNPIASERVTGVEVTLDRVALERPPPLNVRQPDGLSEALSSSDMSSVVTLHATQVTQTGQGSARATPASVETTGRVVGAGCSHPEPNLEPEGSERGEPLLAGTTDELERLHAGIAQGEVRATVASIRRYFRCSQKRAMQLNQRYAKLRSP